MRLFGRRASSSGPTPSTQSQPPDEFAELGTAAMKTGNPGAALEDFGKAIDKLHTMYVIGGCKYRQPSPSDNGILEGFVSAAAAVKVERGGPAVAGAIQKARNYLAEIAVSASQAGAHPSMYLAYEDELARL